MHNSLNATMVYGKSFSDAVTPQTTTLAVAVAYTMA